MRLEKMEILDFMWHIPEIDELIEKINYYLSNYEVNEQYLKKLDQKLIELNDPVLSFELLEYNFYKKQNWLSLEEHLNIINNCEYYKLIYDTLYLKIVIEKSKKDYSDMIEKIINSKNKKLIYPALLYFNLNHTQKLKALEIIYDKLTVEELEKIRNDNKNCLHIIEKQKTEEQILTLIDNLKKGK